MCEDLYRVVCIAALLDGIVIHEELENPNMGHLEGCINERVPCVFRRVDIHILVAPVAVVRDSN